MAAGDDVIYKSDIRVKVCGGKYKNKKITIFQTVQGYKIKLQDNDDVFYCKTLLICQSDYGTNYKKEQNIVAGFNEFPGLVIEMLNKTLDPMTGFYLELKETSIATKLEFCENTPLRRIIYLELMLANERMEEIRHSVLCAVYNNEIEMQASEHARLILMDTIKHYEEVKELLQDENNCLLENQLLCRAQVIKLSFKTKQKIEELEKAYLEKFYYYQKEKEEELRSLKITNNSLIVLNRILEGENSMFKKKMRKDRNELISTIEAKEQVDKDLKILKAKITKYTKELKEVHEQVSYLKKEICHLKKVEEQYEELEKTCLMAKKAFDNCTQKLKECENVLRDQELKIQIMSKTIENLKKEDAQTKAVNALMDKKLKMNADIMVDFRNKLRIKCLEMQNRNKIILKLENENKILTQKTLDLQYEIDFLLKRSTPSKSADKRKEKDGLATYLRDKYQVVDMDLATRNSSVPLDRNEFVKLTEKMENNTLSDIKPSSENVKSPDPVEQRDVL